MLFRSKGGFIYRDASGNAVFNPATLAGNGGTIPAASAPVTYKVGGKSYGYEVNSVGPGRLDGRPAVVDQPFGAGHAFLFASDPFFRAWHESVERQALNALIYPLGPTLPADALSEARAAQPTAEARVDAQTEHLQALTEVAAPLAKKALPAVESRPVASTVNTDNDIRITVYRHDARALRNAVSKARLPLKLRKRIVYVTTKDRYTLVIRGARLLGDDHDQNKWMGPLMRQLKVTYKVKPLFAQL